MGPQKKNLSNFVDNAGVDARPDGQQVRVRDERI
jgi:hypothetical protein